MTNEQYLWMSYFAAAGLGAGLAALAAALLRTAHLRATAGTAFRRLGAVLRRLFPAWLVLAVLLGFLSVSYFDCSHESYARIVADGDHLVATSQEHVTRMLYCLAGTIMGYALMLTVCLCVLQRGGGSRRGQGVR